jgi:sec-independent protein translocase protein TatC
VATAAPVVMPMLDHVEELRRRLFWIVGAMAVATAIALFVVLTFPVIRFLELPIRPYLPSHKLAFTHPTEPFDISLHTAFAFGIAFSFPVIVQQLWGFVRPALTRREERVTVIAIGGSVVLFLAGVALAWGVVLPLAVQWLMGLQTDALTPIVTAREYFAFAIDMALAFGLSFQLPIVIVGLAWLNIVSADRLVAFRRYALFGSVVVGALLTPGDLVWTTLALAAPLYALYEVSIIAARRVTSRRAQ